MSCHSNRNNSKNVDGTGKWEYQKISELGIVLPGTIFIFYLPQNSGPDILKGNDQRLIKRFTMCFCLPTPYPICFSLLVFGFHLLQFSKQILCGLKEGKHTQSNPLLAKWLLACKMKEVDSWGPSFISGFQQGLVPRGKTSWHLWYTMPVRGSLDPGSFAEDILYPLRPLLASSLNWYHRILEAGAKGWPPGWFSRLAGCQWIWRKKKSRIS